MHPHITFKHVDAGCTAILVRGEPKPIATTKDGTYATCYHLTTIPDGDYATFKDAAATVRRDLAE